MFIGHFALAMATKKLNPRPSLALTFLAAQFIDLLWPLFLLLGIERVAIDPGNTAFTPLHFVSYPYSHSLVAVLLWAALFGVVYYAIKKDKATALLLGALVLSHWLLDLVVHRPDLPLSLNEESKVGLGLWNHKAATMILELGLFAAAIYLYASATRALNKWGHISLWSFVLFILAIYFMNALGAPPPSADPIPYVGLAQWLFIAWGYWIDKNRTALHPRQVYLA